MDFRKGTETLSGFRVDPKPFLLLHHRRERIHYAGFQPPEELPRFFSQADVFVLPSRYDGWGVVVNQAAAAGLPVICSDHVGAGYDLVESGRNGMVFPIGDEAALEQAMRHFVEEPDLIGPWGEASRHIASSWTPADGAERWVKAIQQVCPR